MGVSPRPSSIDHVMLVQAACDAVLSLDSLSCGVAADSFPPLFLATRCQWRQEGV